MPRFASLLLLVSLASCGAKVDSVGAFVAAIDEVNAAGRETTIGEYISHIATYYPDLPLKIVNFDCTGEAENVVTSQAIVTSPLEVDGIAIYIHANEQTWDTGVSCENDEFVKNGFSGAIRKVFGDDGVTGTATFLGEAHYGKKSETCEVDFTVAFALETGKGISAEGTICGEAASGHAERITVPGFADEHNLDYLP